MKILRAVFGVTFLIAGIALTSSLAIAAECSCSITCDNGTSCSASGGNLCACNCNPTTLNAECTAFSSASGGVLHNTGETILVNNLAGVRLALKSTVKEPRLLAELLTAASRALILNNILEYDLILTKIDRAASLLSRDEDFAFANALNILNK